MSGVRTSAGTTLKVSATKPSSFDATGYNALTSEIVGEITDLGEFGREFSLVTHQPVGSRGTQKFKGSFNEGSMSLSLGLDMSDKGQLLMKAASLSDADYSFTVTTQNGAQFFFQGKVMSWKVNIGSVDQITTASATIELTSSPTGIGIVESPVAGA